MKFYRYLYYGLYRYWLKARNEWENAQINAVMTMTLFLYMNVLTIIFFFTLVSRPYIVIKLPEPNVRTIVVIITLLIIFDVINYFLLARKKKHDKIVEEFKKKRKEAQLFAKVYLFLSLAVIVVLYFIFK